MSNGFFTTAPSTIVNYPLNGHIEFTIPFEFLARKFVVVTLIGTTKKVLVMGTDYRFVAANKIQLVSQPVGSFTNIEIRRVTSATERLVSFVDGSILRAYDMNLAQIQTIHVAEEARDLAGLSLVENDDGNLDARGRRIVNVVNGIDTGDAVNLGQLRQFDTSTANNADKAAASAASAKQSEINAESSEARSIVAETKAVASAGTAMTAAADANRSKVASKASEVAASGYEQVAKAQADIALTQANRAEQEADRASGYARVQPSVLDYGAIPNSQSDMGFAFAAAAAGSPDGCYVPAGLYLITNDFVNGKFYGEGRYRRTLSDSVGVPFNNPSQSRQSYIAGLDSGKNIAADTWNVFVGVGAGRNATTAQFCTSLGVGGYSGDTLNDSVTDLSPFTGSYCVSIGHNALKKAINNEHCVAIGTDALNENKFGNFNTAMGGSALQQLHTGSNNTAYGRAAGMRLGMITDSTGKRVGFNVANSNTFIGSGAGREFTSGDGNVCVGLSSGRGVTSPTNSYTGTATGSDNTSIGTNSMQDISNGNRNVVIGKDSGNKVSSGSSNVMIGAEAGKSVSSGSGNIIIGDSAGRSVSSDTSNALIISNHGSLPFIQGDMLGAKNSTNRLMIDGSLLPAVANTRLCGNAQRPWAGGATQTAFDITSDARMKTCISTIPDEVLDAWEDVGFYQYKLKDSVTTKGEDKARLHLGVMAQDIITSFANRGLNACDYGIVCLSKWDSEDGLEVRAGERYSVRYEECIVLEMASLRRAVRKLQDNQK